MIVPKSHKIKFSDLTQAEILELPVIIKEIENQYKTQEIISEKSTYGKQLLMCWRSRYWASHKKFLEHLHLHIFPEFENAWDSIIDNKASNIDISLLKK